MGGCGTNSQSHLAVQTQQARHYPIMPSSHSRRNQISSLIYEHALTLDTTADIADSYPSPRPRRRRSVVEVYQNIGPSYFRRAYRMTYDSFCRLHMKLKYGIRETARRLQNIATGVCEGGIMCHLLFLMDRSLRLFVWHVPCVILLGGLHMT